MFAREAYLPRRTAILAACRICAALLPRSPLPSRLPPSATGWGGWPQFLLFTGALGANTLPWLARLPFGWFALVHAVCVLDVAAASLPGVCAAPSFLSAPAQQRFAAAARWLRVLALLAPTPNPPKGAGSCLDQLAPVDGAGAPPPLAACACRQMAVWVLLCVGYSLPLAGQYLAETAAWRRFLRT